eukprot:7327867-Prymnesium_polylepis.1
MQPKRTASIVPFRSQRSPMGWRQKTELQYKCATRCASLATCLNAVSAAALEPPKSMSDHVKGIHRFGVHRLALGRVAVAALKQLQA